jgi:hypothetical protein
MSRSRMAVLKRPVLKCPPSSARLQVSSPQITKVSDSWSSGLRRAVRSPGGRFSKNYAQMSLKFLPYRFLCGEHDPLEMSFFGHPYVIDYHIKRGENSKLLSSFGRNFGKTTLRGSNPRPSD